MYIPELKQLAALLAAGFLISGNAASAQDTDPAEMNGNVAAESMVTTEPEEPIEGAPLGTLAVNPALHQIGLYKEIRYDPFYEEDTEILQQTWTKIFPGDGDGRSMAPSSEFPGLKGALEEFNYREERNASQIRAGMKKAALDELKEDRKRPEPKPFYPYYSKREIFAKRTDQLALSFLCADSSFTHGAHGSYALHGENFDAQTGKRLELTDVFMNVESLPDNVINLLREKYDARALYDSADKTVTQSILDESVNWTLGSRGVTFYFNPYEIAPYASGLLTATILFDERPGLFRETYNRGSAAYCEEIPLWQDTCVSLQDNGLGKKDSIYVTVENDNICIKLNDYMYRDPDPVKDASAVFVHTEDNRNYLYVCCISTNFDENQHWLRVYDLNKPKPSFIGLTYYSFRQDLPMDNEKGTHIRQWIMTDPHEFCINDTSPVYGKAGKIHVVEISEKGTPAFG